MMDNQLMVILVVVVLVLSAFQFWEIRELKESVAGGSTVQAGSVAQGSGALRQAPQGQGSPAPTMVGGC